MDSVIILFISIVLVIFTVIGIKGGRWLWQRLSSSLVFDEGIPKYIKMIGLGFLLSLAVILLLGFYILADGGEVIIRRVTEACTALMYFVAVYNAGYLLSIYSIQKDSGFDKHSLEKEPERMSFSAFTPDPKTLKIFGIVIGVWIPFSIILSIYAFDGVSDIRFYYLVSSIIGAAVGWTFWENLKQTGMIHGPFLKLLKIFSVIFELVVALIVVFGLWIQFTANRSLEYPLMLIYLLLFYLMGAYFLGLLIEVMKR